MFLMAVYVRKAKPCKIYSFNIIDTGLYLLGTWFCLSTLCLHIIEKRWIALIILLVGSFVILFCTIRAYVLSRRLEISTPHLFNLWKGTEE